jgi:hypothetical protein
VRHSKSRFGTRPAVLLVAALALTLSPAAVPLASADPPTPAAPGTLAKSVQNLTQPGSDPANHGDVVNWVLSHADNGEGGTVSITDQITAGQSFVPGSLRVPPDWTPAWSTDGTTFSTTEPATGTVAVRGSIADLQPGGTSLARLLLPPVQPTTTSTGGDGFTPVLYRSPNGAVESWNIYHHLVPAAPKVVCINLLNSQPCSGGPWPRPVNTTPGPLGAGNTGDLGSPMAAQFVFDPTRPGLVYYPAFSNAALGVACLDLDARANCGFFPLIATGGSPSSNNNLAGFVEHGGNLYGVSTTGAVLCFTMASQSPCAGQPYPAVVAPHSNQPAAPGNLQYFGSLTLAAGKIFMSSSPTSGATAGCFDPATTSACTGWAAPKPAGPAGLITYGIFNTYTTTGDVEGICVPPAGGVYQLICYTLAGATLTPPAFPALPNGVLTFNPKTITAPDGHLRSYFPFWGGPILGATGCYDWNTDAACAGMPFPRTHPNAGNGNTRDYGYDYDAAGECLIGLGDAGLLFSLDPITGASPCFRAGTSLSLSTPDFYCDGQTGHITGYQDARLVDIDVANIDLANSSATVTKPDGTPIAVLPFEADGSVDLSGVSPATHPALVIDASLRLLNVDDFTGGNEPHLVAGFVGDPPQICFQTTLSTSCQVTGVSNTGSGNDSGGQFTSNTVQLPIAPGPACLPNLVVDKEICRDARPSRCGPGGAGPWGKTSPAGLLGLLGTAYWRITVTNTGQAGAEQVTLNDQVAPSCVSAAGTFTLAAGASRQIYCSSFLLLLPLTNTASATYRPAGAPVGTPPATSAPSSATACSIVCVLFPPNRAPEPGSL